MHDAVCIIVIVMQIPPSAPTGPILDPCATVEHVTVRDMA